MSAPKVFISYSHDSEQHKVWVRRLAADLRESGVDAVLDQWDLVPGQDLALFMQKGIIDSTRVLLVCTENYIAKAESGCGGVGYERLVVTTEVVQSIDTKKFIPIVRDNPTEVKVPRFLGPRLYIDFSDDVQYEEKREKLLRELLGAPALIKPPLGGNPFSPVVGEPVARMAGPTGQNASGAAVLSEMWFENERATAQKGIQLLNLNAFMEVRCALHQPIRKSPIELLNAMRNSGIHTFGWPLGVLLENRDEYRPKPYADAIKAEIAINDKDSFMGRQSYDYWALRTNGDFYLLQSLFEDQRTENAIFFNTRIVRVAEAFLFASNLYDHLGTGPTTPLSVRVTHGGLAGRNLSTSNPSRDIFPATCHESEAQVEIVTSCAAARDDVIKNVKAVTEPLFMLFDFREFEHSVYADIVTRFQAGQTS